MKLQCNMKTGNQQSQLERKWKWISLFSANGAVQLLLSLAITATAAENAKTFATPEEAATALASAASTKDNEALHAIFGPASEDLENPDRVQGTNEMTNFTAAYEKAHRLMRQTDSK